MENPGDTYRYGAVCGLLQWRKTVKGRRKVHERFAEGLNTTTYNHWLVVWNIFYFSIYWE